MGRDRVKKKTATSFIPSASLAAGSDEALTRLMVIEYASQTVLFMSMKKEGRIAFLENKVMEMKMQKRSSKIKQQMLANQENMNNDKKASVSFLLSVDHMEKLLLLKKVAHAHAEGQPLARETNRLCGEVVVMVEEKGSFFKSWKLYPKRPVLEKMAEFLRETQSKDTERMLQLQILGREEELRALKKELFIEKLKVMLSPAGVKKVNYAFAVASVTVALNTYLLL
nr:hypothetical protein [Tanacetum cinerariifolium]